MKYVLIKNARKADDCDFKLSSGEILFECDDYSICRDKILDHYDSPQNRTKWCHDEWELMRDMTDDSISFCQAIIENRDKYGGEFSYDIYALTPFWKYWMDVVPFEYVLEHFLYAKGILSDSPPNSAMEHLERKILIDKDLARRVLPYLKGLKEKQAQSKGKTPRKHQSDVDSFLIEAIADFEKQLARLAVTADDVDSFFHAWKENIDMEYWDCPHRVRECNDEPPRHGDSYAIFVEFSDPAGLLADLTAEMNENLLDGDDKFDCLDRYWDIWNRLYVPANDSRDNELISEDIENLTSSIIKLLAFSPEEMSAMGLDDEYGHLACNSH